MKWPAQSVTWTHRAWSDAGDSVERTCLTGKETSTAQVECGLVASRRAAGYDLATSLRVVGVLAFCQMAFFLALLLFICARAGAATTSNSTSKLELILSTYATQTQRDPFGSEIPKSGTPLTAGTTLNAGADTFKLMGILYDAVKPSALVNNEIVELNKPVKVETGQGTVEIKALSITRDTVVLDVQGQKMELRLGGDDRGNKGSK
jgi:hypothetical protein